MTEAPFKLKNAPIVEAVLDFDCDMPLGFNLSSLENACQERLNPDYPIFQTQFMAEHKFEPDVVGAKMSVRQEVKALRFRTADEKQLVQVRSDGYSFNRLTPYSSLDDYYPEIERTWKLFLQVTNPVQIRRIALRYINRIDLPLSGRNIEFSEFLQVPPRVPREDQLAFGSFLNQQTTIEIKTGNVAIVTIASQQMEKGSLPLLLDISAIHPNPMAVADWPEIHRQVEILRSLKNSVFRSTLTERCLRLFQ